MLVSGEVENAKVRKPKYGNQNTEIEVRKPKYRRKREAVYWCLASQLCAM